MNRHLSDKIPAPTSGRLLLLALLLCICGGVSADPQAVQHLPNLTIRNFAQDKVGYIWIATDNGLCRYNGQTYYYYQSEPDDPASLRLRVSALEGHETQAALLRTRAALRRSSARPR